MKAMSYDGFTSLLLLSVPLFCALQALHHLLSYSLSKSFLGIFKEKTLCFEYGIWISHATSSSTLVLQAWKQSMAWMRGEQSV